MTFRLVPKSVTLNDLERRNGYILRYFTEFGSFRGALRKRGWDVVVKSSRSLSHLLMSLLFLYCWLFFGFGFRTRALSLSVLEFITYLLN